MTFRTPAAETKGALSRTRFALMSTYAILAQLMEDMLHLQPTEIRQVIRAERKGSTMAGSKPAGDQLHNSSECGGCVTVRRKYLRLPAFASISPYSSDHDA